MGSAQNGAKIAAAHAMKGVGQGTPQRNIQSLGKSIS